MLGWWECSWSEYFITLNTYWTGSLETVKKGEYVSPYLQEKHNYTYKNLKAALIAFVYQAPATPEYKFLQLMQCLANCQLETW